MAHELRTTREHHIGLAFPVKDAKWAGDPYTRNVVKAGHIALRTDILGRDGVTFTLTLDGKPLVNLNKVDAEALGMALVRATD